MQRAMTPRQRQRDAIEKKALRARYDQAEKAGKLHELRLELGVEQPPQVDPAVEAAHDLLREGRGESFVMHSDELTAEQLYKLRQSLTDEESAVLEQAMKNMSKEVDR